MYNKKNITIGFDLGIASVGWAIIDSTTSKILNWGTRTFEERKTANERRAFRSIRRNIRRKVYRNQKFINLILKYKDLFELENISDIQRVNKKDTENYEKILSFFTEIYRKCAAKHSNILEVKVKALDSKIEKLDLIWILHDYLENRGFFYDLEEENVADKYEGIEHPSILLYDFFKKNGFFKSNSSIPKDLGGYSFSNLQWVNEIKKLFEVQEINPEFSEKFLNLFTSVRDFAKGPGSEHSASEYGIFQKDEDGKVAKKYDNIWDKTIGKCSFFVDKNRSPVNYPSYEIFNLLNQLINLSTELKTEHKKIWQLSSNDRNELLDELLKVKENAKIISISLKKSEIKKIILKDFEFEKSDIDDQDTIEGRKIIKEEPTTKLEVTKHLLATIYSHSSDSNWVNINNILEFLPYLDEICIILDREKSRGQDEVLKKLTEKNIFEKLKIDSEKQLDFVKSIFSNTKFNFKKIGNFSLDAINEFLPKMFEQNKNSEYLKWKDEEIRKKWEEQKAKLGKTDKKTKYLNPRIFQDEIISPGTKNTFEQAVLVLNQIIKKYSKENIIDAIVIESPREKNDKETIKKIKQRIKEGKDKNLEKLFKILNLERGGYKLSDLKTKPARLLNKLRLYHQQEGVDLYTLTKIDIDDLINNSQKYEIDHIIPYSMSYDDSQANKILTTKAENLKKGKLIASEYIKTKGDKFYNEYYEKAKELFNKKNKKTKKLDSYVDLDEDSAKNRFRFLTLQDYDEFQVEFLARNLNDTRYSTKLFYHALIDHFENNEFFTYIDQNSSSHKVKISTIKGHVTRYFRSKPSYINKQDIEKKRENNEHHAVDAAIVAIIGNENRQIANLLTLADNKNDKKFILHDENYKENIETGELVKISKFEAEKLAKVEDLKKIIQEKYEEAKNHIPIKFSRKIRSTLNGGLSDQTLYGFKYDEKEEKYFKIIKKNLITSKNTELKKYFENPFGKTVDTKGVEKSEYTVLMAQSHLSEFNKLKEIFEKYNGFSNKSGNAFVEYMNDLALKEPNLKAEIESANSVKKLLYYNYKPTDEITYYDNINKKNFKRFYKNIRIIEYKSVPIKFKILSKHDGGKSFKDDLFSLYSLVYKVYEKGKEIYKSIPINSLTTKFGINKFDFLDENLYNKEKLYAYKSNFKKPIPVNCKPIFALKKGTILKKKILNIDDFKETKEAEEGNYYFISKISKRFNSDTGYGLKPLTFNVSEAVTEPPTNSIFQQYIPIHLDELGNEYPIKIKEHTDDEKLMCTIK
ncbi:type II CRISPR RNA-guided endonuclease Cas9 [Mesomycoplasma ovipneumoniae]|uniref:type II CRISPR RNA-guided endonuclease Cas9 n=1 Tax=Mesomycoplasma ovipneumoniae TaxID=29562 RepID=UPI00296439B3|nr:type II CRISPR RNA-guided endonuclease Cas9 [Mesomycoplasma ovipneumoniae]MDW2834953.1 type II CRISPR RNA-guided endonuclease Cas9 [Mesomycoplasma ovipneumoniae]MDW2835811.1 type II CRISPR RNA-guided endonuclease Cas9 [Mesomycoplasma ovipneumoniae]MDW2890948.1 type II CRISPR RNA-guided endonuclease Cas9 [Mesomycoplasma ovipneumoniae]